MQRPFTQRYGLTGFQFDPRNTSALLVPLTGAVDDFAAADDRIGGRQPPVDILSLFAGGRVSSSSDDKDMTDWSSPDSGVPGTKTVPGEGSRCVSG